MLTYKQALKEVLRHAKRLRPRSLPLEEALGLRVSRDLFSPEPFPAFDNSAVDGYAVPSNPEGPLKIQGEIPAGKFFKDCLKPGYAVRVFTGAPVPKGTYAVVMQEDTQRINGSVSLLKKPEFKEHIRFRGEDFRAGKRLVKKGTMLEPAHLAVLAAVGAKRVPVIPRPQVAILVTGSELLKKGERVKPGMIRDSNTILLKSMIRNIGGIPHVLESTGDDPEKIGRLIPKGLANDLLIISGGVSVGKYDFVKEVLKKERVREIFWRVNIKPGKPVFFGRKGRCLVFGLPGNPVSVFVTFEKLVKPAILQFQGKKQTAAGAVRGYLRRAYQNGSRLHFLRVRFLRRKNRCELTPLKGQGSHMMGELARANALLQVEPNARLRKNQRVTAQVIREE